MPNTSVGRVSARLSGLFSTYLLPFGRYSRATEVEHPANEVLVGREGQRAYLIDLLISLGKRGAYLVTGRRGAGKTIFVRECLAEYEESVLERTFRGTQAKGLWDHLSITVIWVGILLGAVLLSEFSSRVAPLTGSLKTFDYLLWLLLLPFLLAFYYPAIYAKEVLESILERGKTEGSSFAQNTSGIFVLLFILAILNWAASSTPSIVLARLWLFVMAAYMTVNVFSYFQPQSEKSASKWLGIMVLVAGPSIWLLVTDYASLLPPIFGNRWNLLFWGVAFFGVGNLLRATYQRRHLPKVKAEEWRKKFPEKEQTYDKLGSAYRRGASWYLVGGLIALGIAGLSLWRSYSLQQLGITVGVFLALGLIAHRLHRPVPGESESPGDPKASRPFVPQPEVILVLKAGISAVVAVQLSAPTLSRIPRLGEWFPFLHHYHSTFANHEDEMWWLLIVFGLVCCLTWIEYEWVVRPYIRQRQDKALSPEGDGLPAWSEGAMRRFGNDNEGNPAGDRRRQREYYRQLAGLTLPWITYRAWSPTLVVSVNLGFDRLDHRRVVQAMLAGLREQYHRTFLSWSSGTANVRHFLLSLLLVFLTTAVGFSFFGRPFRDTMLALKEQNATQAVQVPKDQEAKQQSDYPSQPTDVCDGFAKVAGSGERLEVVPIRVLCKVPGNWFVETLYASLVPAPITHKTLRKEEEKLLFDRLLPSWQWQDQTALDVRVYHVLIFLVLLIIGQWAMRLIPVLPYRDNLRRIDDVLQALASRTRTTRPRNLWKPARWIFGLFGTYESREEETDPVDPRTVELAFLHVLDDLQQSGVRLPGSVRSRVSIPTPEITFVFDELDKLGSRSEPTSTLAAGAELSEEFEVLSQERQRSQALIHLLSDLKNLISSAPARFIFIAGRNLHDEWLADQTSRHPLLSSVFSAEVYLPSLLTDHAWRGQAEHSAYLTRRIEEFWDAQRSRANKLQRLRLLRRFRPFVGQPVTSLRPEAFVQGRLLEGLPSQRALDQSQGKELGEVHKKGMLSDFLIFLAHRSMGNPKRLHMLLASFVRPTARVAFGQEGESNWHHVLQFLDSDIVRHQLVASIHRQVVQPFEESLVKRDDKIVISLLYLTDYLFKFHRRAFSWSNLERVDELIHIHRAPDSREILQTLVELCSERYLHSVLNGMYEFRFRSDVAQEVEYLSRQSPEEMAAFNFTLDESQALKALLSATLRADPKDSPDVLAGLGELYEFDEEYETARQYYGRAIESLDGTLRRGLGLDVEIGSWPSILSILASRKRGLHIARLVLDWGTARVRLLLQIGMTWELAGNLERAEATYRDSRTLSRALLRSYVDEAGREVDGLSGLWDASVVDVQRLDILKHMNIVFQAIFAEAWVMEKLPGGIDTSASRVERELAELRVMLPFMRNPAIRFSKDPAYVTGSNFALIASQLHRKAGDLYFFKGIPFVEWWKEEKLEEVNDTRDGYLFQSHLHYCISLHELRRFLVHRRKSSEFKLCPWPSDLQQERIGIKADWQRGFSLSSETWPDFVARASAGVTSDIGETILARASFVGLITESRNLELQEPEDFEENGGLVLGRMEAGAQDEGLGREHRSWIEEKEEPMSGPGLRKVGVEIGGKVLELGCLDEWFGVWDSSRESYGAERDPLIVFRHHPHSSHQRLSFGLHLCLSAVEIHRRGGYYEDGGRELLQVAEAVSQYIWWYQIVYFLKAQGLLPTTLILPKEEDTEYLIDHLSNLGLFALESAVEYFRKSRRRKKRHEFQATADSGDFTEERRESAELFENVIPVFAVSVLCSIGLGLGNNGQKSAPESKGFRVSRREKIGELLENWNFRPDEQGAIGTDRESLRRYLSISASRHRYPISNRLAVLKILLDDAALNDSEASEDLMLQAERLRRLSNEYQSPLHFTPLMVGSSLALAWIQGGVRGAKGMSESDEEGESVNLRNSADRYLRRSAEMYSHKRAYYEAIEDLYYLYDDFSDRKIHFNQAIQIAGREICGLLRRALSVAGREKSQSESKL